MAPGPQPTDPELPENRKPPEDSTTNAETQVPDAASSGSSTDAIPEAVEDQVLDILDATEPGAERDAALHALGLPPEVRAAVDQWIASDAVTEVESQPIPFRTDTPKTKPPTPQTLPRQLGDYMLESVLGKGGMGIVYRARDLRLGRTVALKVLPERFLDDPRRKTRFEREMRAIAALSHPAIVPVFTADPTAEVPFYTMELVSGRSLDKVIRHLGERQRPVGSLRYSDWLRALGVTRESGSSESGERTYLEAVCKLMIQIGSALQHAHEQGVTHRDVKPSNIIAEGSHQARLFDFGLARLDDGLSMTQSSELIGSPHYMSPEQIQGGVIDARTDIYSLGVTMYELLTLQVPFDEATPQQVYQAILNRDPRRPGLLNPQLPMDLETICLTAMEKDPSRRFASAGEFAEDLRRFLRFEPILARPIGSVTRSVRWLRRNRTPVSIVTLVIIALVAVFLMRDTQEQVKTITTDRDRIQRDVRQLMEEKRKAAQDLASLTASAEQARNSLLRKQEELGGIEKQLEDARRAVADQQRISANLGDKNRQLQASNTALQKTSAAQKAELARLRGIETELTSERSKLAQEIQAEQVKLGSARTELLQRRAEVAALERNFRLSTVQNVLMESRGLRTTNPSLGLMLALEAAELADSIEAEVAVQTRIDDTLLALLAVTQEERTLPEDTAPVTAVAFAPLGNRVVTATHTGQVRIWDRDTERELASVQTGPVAHVEFLAEDWLLIATEDGLLATWDGRSGSTTTPVLEAFHRRQVRHHVDPGRTFLIADPGPTPGRLHVYRRGSTRPDGTIGDEDFPIAGFQFTSTPNRVLVHTTQRTVELWDLASGTRQLRIATDTEIVAADIDQEDRRMAVLDARGRLSIYRVEDEVLVLRTEINEGQPVGDGRVAFCADSRRLWIHALGVDSHLLVEASNGEIRARHPIHRVRRTGWLGPRGRLLCVPDPDGRLAIVHLGSGQVLARLGDGTSMQTLGPASCAFSDDQSAVVSVEAGRARIWRTRPGGLLGLTGPATASTFNIERLRNGHYDPVHRRVLTVSNLGLRVWSMDTGLEFLVPQDSQRPLTPQALTPAGGVTFLSGVVRQLVSGPRPRVQVLGTLDATEVDQVFSWPGYAAAATLTGTDLDQNRRLVLIDAAGKIEKTLPLPSGRGGGGTPQPSPDGRRFAIGYDALTLVETNHPTRRVRLPFSRRPAVFTPDSRRIAATTGYSIKVWNARTGGTWCTLPDADSDRAQVVSLAFDARGQRLASAWSDGTIHVDDCGTRQPSRIATFRSTDATVRSVCFSRDGTRLLAAGDDGFARVYRTADPAHPPLQFETPDPCVQAMFNEDGTWAIVLGPRFIRRFPLAPRRLARAQCPRRLTPSQRTAFGLPAR